MKKKLQKLSFKKFIEGEGLDRFGTCPSMECEQIYQKSKNGNSITLLSGPQVIMPKDTHFECDHCMKSYCVQCENIWHEGLTCEQFKSMLKDGDDLEEQLT